MNDLLVTSVLFMPLIGLIPILFMPKSREHQIKWVALGFSLVTFALAVCLLLNFDTTVPGLQHIHKVMWLSFGNNIHIDYFVGVDGLSILLVMLTVFIMPLAILFSLESVKDRIRLYYSFMLILEFALIGAFVAHDLFLFFVFWEVSLVPMYFIVGIWGAEQRIYAAVKLFLYTMAGSLLMLLSILWIGTHFGTFDVQQLTDMVQKAGPAGTAALFGGAGVEALLFLGFFAAFAVKVPIWPLHSWLPDAHVQAPTAGSVILAGVLLKLGTYGLVRFCLGLFPDAAVQFAPFIGGLAIIGIIYGAWVSYAQSDVKKLVAYSSISHLGFVVLGIFAIGGVQGSAHAIGLSGATLQMVNHGISTGGLFLLVGMLYERRHTKAINAFGGIWKVLPIFSGLALIITLSSMGLPGLNGFVGEFTILLGAFGSTVLGPVFAALATLGVILAAVYLLYMWNKVFMGEVTHDENNHLPALRWNETAALVIVVIFAVIMGLFPKPFFNLIDKSVGEMAKNTAQYAPTPNTQTAQIITAQVNPK